MVQVGYITFSQSGADQGPGAVPPYLYGRRRYVDITHDFDIDDMNRVKLTLVDVSVMEADTSPECYRDGENPMSGETLTGKRVYFRNLPHWAPKDLTTVRVWATMSLGHPTDMKFWYILESV